MKDNNILNKLNNDGLTLVEVIVSMTLLAIVAAILLTGVMAAGSINSRSVDLTNEGYNQASMLEEDSNDASDGVESNIRVTVGGESSLVSGYLISRNDDNTGVGFTMFVPEVVIPTPL